MMGISVNDIKRRPKGFTLIELMVGVLLISILMSIGVPLFRDFIVSQKLRAISSDLSRAVITARSEAVKRNRTVEITPDDEGWGVGWTVNELDASSAIVEPPLLTHVQSGDVTITAITDPLNGDLRLTPSGRTTVRVNFEIDVGPEQRAVGCMELGTDGRSDYCPVACPFERCDDGACPPCPT